MFTDCLIPTEGHRNQDGYIRQLDKPRSAGGKLKMLHRLVWEAEHGSIPLGYEVNHLCKIRDCVNILHLECLSTKEHRIKDNQLRYLPRAIKIFEYTKENPHKLQKEVAKIFSVSQQTVSKIIKRMENT